MSRYVRQIDHNHRVDGRRYHSRDRDRQPTDGYRFLLRPEAVEGLERYPATSGTEYLLIPLPGDRQVLGGTS